jgi:hypothetical protein
MRVLVAASTGSGTLNFLVTSNLGPLLGAPLLIVVVDVLP